MRRARITRILAPTLVAACAGNPDRHTLAELHDVAPDVAEVKIESGLDQAMLGYKKFLEEAPESELTPEAMRRLADLKLEKEYGLLGGDGKPAGLPAPETAPASAGARPEPPAKHAPPVRIAGASESDQDFERRATQVGTNARSGKAADLELPRGEQATPAGPLEAIELYDKILATYPTYQHNDEVLYQKARALDELGRVDEAIGVVDRLIASYPHSRHIDEVHFRRAEYFFTRKKFRDAESAYAAITAMGVASEYYELALYKLGWTFYKQDLLEEALDQYVALLDYKVSTGYDFDHARDEDEERRIADTYRVISLCFSSLGGPQIIEGYFTAKGQRSYEDRIYSHLGEFYLEKLRYNDAAAAYRAFVGLHPLHRASPRFSMRVIEIYEAGDFPKLVLESKKEFAATYGLDSEYWRHFAVADSPEVVSYLKANLKDLANHYHALYQEAELADERPANFQEASRWYRAYLGSFPKDADTPPINYRLADLLLEHQDFGEAAREYERTAYEYPGHDRAAAAGYAAIYAHRQHQKAAGGAEQELARQEAVKSTLRFVDAFPNHEHAAAVLGAAVDDMYEMKEFQLAIGTGQRLIDRYPEADPSIRRSAWTVVAHSSFETSLYPQAERAYARVLEMTPAEDKSRQGVLDNLAAAIYKQGEQANAAQDYRSAADHFLRVAQAAPTSGIRPVAEYDAGAALIRLKDWAGAASVLDAFRKAYPDHQLNREATKQMAFVYREEGNLSGAAGEYERVATESEDPELRREALLTAGELYENSKLQDRALAVYLRYVDAFPEPAESAVETRFKIAGMYKQAHDDLKYREQLQQIVEIDGAAGAGRTARIRYLAAQSALVLAEELYHRFGEVQLLQPFERSLQEKQRRLNAALDAFGKLVDYEVGDVTAAATFYMAELYFEFNKALVGSERPPGLAGAEIEEYETALEEEAFPFEERAIEVHKKNLELLASGVYSPWIEKSLARLADLVPGRYAKFEASSGLISSIDQYAYQAPIVPVVAAEPEGGAARAATPPGPAPDEPQAVDPSESVPAAPAPEILEPTPQEPTPQADPAPDAARSEADATAAVEGR